MKCLKIITIFTSIVCSTGVHIAWANQSAPQTFTFDGRAYSNSSASTPMLDVISTKIQILNPAQDCILYEETQSIDTTTTNGYFSVQVGAATGVAKRTAGDSNNAMSLVYSNSSGSLSGKLVSNGGACSYTPTIGDKRYVRMQMTPAGDGVTRTISPNVALDSVPNALVAERAETIQGLTPVNLLQTKSSGSYVLSQANLESVFTSTNFSRLTSLLSISPTNYIQTGSNGSATLPSVSGSPGSGLAMGQIWYDSSSNVLKYYDGAVKTLGTSGGSVTNVSSANSYISVATGSTTPVITANVGTTANTLAAGNDSRITGALQSGTAAGGSLSGTYPNPSIAAGAITNTEVSNTAAIADSKLATISTAGKVSGSAITSGTITGSTVVNTSGNIQTSGSFVAYDSGPTNAVSIKAPASVTASYNLVLPSAKPSVSGYLLSGDTSGNLSWVAPSTSSGTVTSVSSANADIGVATGTTTPVLTLNSGTGANQIVKLDGSSRLPAVDGSLLTNIFPSQTGNAGKVLQTNGTTTSWASASAGTVTSVTSANSYLSIATGTSTPVITANVGIAANTLAAGDDSRITGALQTSAYAIDVADTTSCTAAERPYWNTVSDKWMCSAIGSLDASTITAGTIATARLGSGTADNTTFLRGDGTWTSPGGVISGLTTGYIPKATSATAIGNSALFETGGKVGIGTTSPQYTIDATGGSQRVGTFIAATGSYGYTTASDLGMGVNHTGGYMGVVNAVGSSDTQGALQGAVYGVSAVDRYGLLTLSRPNSGWTSGTISAQANGDYLAGIGFAGQTSGVGSSGMHIGASIMPKVDGVVSSGVLPTAITFLTSITNNSGLTERMRITSTGNIGIGTNSPNTTLDLSGAVSVRGMAAPTTSAAGQGRIYFDSTANKFKVSENNGAYVDLVGGASGVSGSGTTGTIPKFSASSTLSDSAISESTTVNFSKGLVVAGSRTIQADPGNNLNLTDGGGTNSVNIGSSITLSGSSMTEVFSGSATKLRVNSGNTSKWDFATNYGVDNNLYLSPAAGGGNFIISSTNVGIGTSSPSNALSVTGSANVSSTLGLGITAAPSYGFEAKTNSMFFYTTGGTAYLYASSGLVNIGSSSTPVNKLGVGGGTAIGSTYVGSTAPTNGLLVEGNVGVGTSSPSANLHVAGTATASGTTTALKVAAAANTNQTLSTEIPDLDFNLARTVQWATGALTTQRAVKIQPPTLSFVGASTVTDAATLGITGAPVKGTNATITNTHGILVNAGAVSTATNSYGLSVNAQTGATNNYSAQFLGGNVGIGTSSPSNKLSVSGSIDVTTDLRIGTTSNSSASEINIVKSKGSGTYVQMLGQNTNSAGGTAWGLQNNGTIGAFFEILGSTYSGGYTSETANSVVLMSTGSNLSLVTHAAFPLQMWTNETERMRIDSAGNVGIGTTSPQTTLQVAGVISPSVNNTYTLGNATYRFTEVYATNGVINTSDRREKKNIFSTDLGLDFINRLRPVSYRWNTGVDDDIHYGLIAQEAEQALIDSGKSEKTSIVTHDQATDRYGVRYSELISPVIKAIQELYNRIVGVEDKLATIQASDVKKDRELASIKSENLDKDQKIKHLEQENADMKNRLEKIEKALLRK